MKSFGIILVLISMGHARPSDYDDLSPEKLSYGLKSTEQDDYSNPSDEHNEPNAFPKFPDNLEYDNESKEVKRSERKAEDQKISLRSLISSIESDLVSKAKAINANVRLRRSFSEKTVNEANSSEIITSTDGLIDANKNLFEGLFEYTRAERQSSEENDKDVKIPLDGLVQAVETTLINSAKKLNDPETSKPEKRDIASIDKNSQSNRGADESLNDKQSTDNIQVKKITSLNVQDLNLLKPIAFNAAPSVDPPSSMNPISCNDNLITSTDISPNQHTNISVKHSSNIVHLVPGNDQKLAHVQHQQIQQTVFHSNLAIFPTIPPQSINVPNLIQTTTQENADDTTVTIHSITPTTEKTVPVDLDKLMEKIAEIQADPVILSQV